MWDGARVLGRTSLLATNLVWLLWAVWGGFFITKIILSNWLAITIKPVFDKPVDTAEVGRGQREVNGLVNKFHMKVTLSTTKCFRMCMKEA